jgi:hypothetical protein
MDKNKYILIFSKFTLQTVIKRDKKIKIRKKRTKIRTKKEEYKNEKKGTII